MQKNKQNVNEKRKRTKNKDGNKERKQVIGGEKTESNCQGKKK